jgi:hypothetical protein
MNEESSSTPKPPRQEKSAEERAAEVFSDSARREALGESREKEGVTPADLAKGGDVLKQIGLADAKEVAIIAQAARALRTGTSAKEKADKERRAAARRKAFKLFMQERDLSPAILAKKAGLPNANGLYNFINGHSASIAQSTIEKLARATGTSSAEMFGEAQAVGLHVPVIISRVRAESHKWRPNYEILGRSQGDLPVLPGMHLDEAVVVGDDHVNQIFPKGSVVGIASMSSLGRRGYLDGDRVLLHRVRGSQHEVTIRQLEVAPDSKSAELIFRSTDPRFGSRLPVRCWPYDGSFFEMEGDRYQIRGRCVLGMRMEDDL